MPIKNGLVDEEGKKKIATQVIGNIGLYCICYELCQRGWNVMPTSRNVNTPNRISKEYGSINYVTFVNLYSTHHSSVLRYML